MNNDRFKFRAWDFVKKKMHYFDLFEYADDQDCYYNSYVFPSEQDFKNGKAILLQSTGLKDENGKLIFEGDIVFVTDSMCQRAINKIEMNDGCWEIQSNSTGRDYLKCHTCNHAVEIIGNIYENPELLEKK